MNWETFQKQNILATENSNDLSENTVVRNTLHFINKIILFINYAFGDITEEKNKLRQSLFKLIEFRNSLKKYYLDKGIFGLQIIKMEESDLEEIFTHYEKHKTAVWDQIKKINEENQKGKEKELELEKEKGKEKDLVKAFFYDAK